MNTSPDIQQHLISAIVRLLRPLVRLLLRYGIPYGTFADAAKRVYVDVAMSDFDLPGRKQTVSRTSVITGLSRKEVSRVLNSDQVDTAVTDEKYNRAARVIAAWVREQPFTDTDGNPRTLLIDDDQGFAGLVKRFSGDVPARAILDELLRVGAIKKTAENKVQLQARSYIPESGEPEKMNILGQDVAGLISTIEHNLDPDHESYFQRKVFYDNLPNEVMDQLQDLTRKHGQELIEQLDNWMAQHDRDENPSAEGSGRRRVGIGVYYFEEANTQEGIQ
jgi:hypothetical protein